MFQLEHDFQCLSVDETLEGRADIYLKSDNLQTILAHLLWPSLTPE
jgi:hypothetical protein